MTLVAMVPVGLMVAARVKLARLHCLPTSVICDSDGIPERIFQKSRQQKIMQDFLVVKDLNALVDRRIFLTVP